MQQGDGLGTIAPRAPASAPLLSLPCGGRERTSLPRLSPAPATCPPPARPLPGERSRVALWCGFLFVNPPRFVSPLAQMLKVAAFMCVCAAAWYSQGLAAAAAAAGGRSDPGNFLDDKQWLTTVSQYDKEVGQWNKFRDVSSTPPHLLVWVHPRVGSALLAGGGRRRGHKFSDPLASLWQTLHVPSARPRKAGARLC